MSESRFALILSNDSIVTTAGACYAILLGLVAILCAGFGHGTYIPAEVTSSPWGFVNIPAALAGGPATWSILSFLAVRGSPWFKPAISSHYVSAVILVSIEEEGLTYLQRVPEIFWLWVVLYAVGQCALWNIYYRNAARTKTERNV